MEIEIYSQGFATCPDCGATITCGTGGIQNLNKRHWGGKSCRKYLGDDVTITIYRLVPDYVVGRSTSRH